MTIHLTTITSNVVVVVSDRLISTKAGYKPLHPDKYKHLVLSTDDAHVVVSFAGFAGILSGSKLKETTIDWITRTIWTYAEAGHYAIDQHVNNIKNRAEEYIAKMGKGRAGFPEFRLAIELSGWTAQENFICRVENCLDSQMKWIGKPRSSFQRRIKKFPKAFFTKVDCYCHFLSHEELGMKQLPQRKALERVIPSEDPRKIFDASVKIIQTASLKSEGRIGMDCSGVVLKKKEGASCFDTRKFESGMNIMPNIIWAKSNRPVAAENLKLIFQPT